MVKAFIQSTEYIDEDLVHNGSKLALSKTDSRAELVTLEPFANPEERPGVRLEFSIHYAQKFNFTAN